MTPTAEVIDISTKLNAELRKPEPYEPIPFGLHQGFPSERYHRRGLGVVSKSALDVVSQSLMHYKAWVDGLLEESSSTALLFGKAFHCAVLEPDQFAKLYTVEPDFGDCRFKENKAKRDEWRKEHAQSIHISEADMTAITGMATALRKHPLGSKMIRDGQPELTVSWQDKETGLSCKCRADYYVAKHGMVADIKSTDDASFDEFKRDIVRYRYHVQDALYRDGFGSVGAAVNHFIFIAIEKKPPHAIAIYSLDSMGISKGYDHARIDIDALAEGMRTGDWRGYPTGIQTIDLPPWA